MRSENAGHFLETLFIHLCVCLYAISCTTIKGVFGSWHVEGRNEITTAQTYTPQASWRRGDCHPINFTLSRNFLPKIQNFAAKSLGLYVKFWENLQAKIFKIFNTHISSVGKKLAAICQRIAASCDQPIYQRRRTHTSTSSYRNVLSDLATQWRHSQSLHRLLPISCFQLLREQQLKTTDRQHTRHRHHTYVFIELN